MVRRLLLLLFLTATPVQAAVYQDLIDYRQALFRTIEWNFKGARDALRPTVLDRTELVRRAEALAALSRLPMDGFRIRSPEGPTEALPEVWEQPQLFAERLEEFQRQAARLAVLAPAADRPTLEAGIRAVARSCKACHRDFRKD